MWALSPCLQGRCIHIDRPQFNHRSKDAYVFSLASLLKQSDSLSLCRQAHDHILKHHSHGNNTFLCNFLLETYGRFGHVNDAQSVFDHMPKHNLHSWNVLLNLYGLNASPFEACLVFGRMPVWDVVSWTSIIMAFSQHGSGKEALYLLFEMLSKGVVPNKITFLCSIEACTSLSSLVQGQIIHILIVKYGYEKETIIGTGLISLYGKCGCVAHAIDIFESMTECDIAAWNALLASLSCSSEHQKTWDLFKKMQLEGIIPDYVSFVSVLDACRSLEEGLELHGTLVYRGLDQIMVVNNTLINMYGKYDCLLDASSVFSNMLFRTAVSWNAMITICANNAHGKEALYFFFRMQADGFMTDKVSFLGALRACASLANLELGHVVHALWVEDGYGLDKAIDNTIISMYGWCGSVDDLQHVFNNMSNPDIVTWSCMMRVHYDADQVEEALDLFYWMHLEGFRPNEAIVICAIESCAALGAQEQGHVVHAYAVQLGIDKDMLVKNTLLMLYGKCGNTLDAMGLFSKMDEQDTISWTGAIAAFTFSGCSKEALDVLCKMQLEGSSSPDKTTFLCVLSAFNHAGEVEYSKHLFFFLVRDCSILDINEHFLCMIDLLGRAGRLDEAESLVKEAPAECALEAWQCLMGACRIHVDTDRGARAADQVLRMGVNNATLNVMLANLYSFEGR